VTEYILEYFYNFSVCGSFVTPLVQLCRNRVVWFCVLRMFSASVFIAAGNRDGIRSRSHDLSYRETGSPQAGWWSWRILITRASGKHVVRNGETGELSTYYRRVYVHSFSENCTKIFWSC